MGGGNYILGMFDGFEDLKEKDSSSGFVSKSSCLTSYYKF